MRLVGGKEDVQEVEWGHGAHDEVYAVGNMGLASVPREPTVKAFGVREGIVEGHGYVVDTWRTEHVGHGWKVSRHQWRCAVEGEDDLAVLLLRNTDNHIYNRHTTVQSL